ncbi:MAG: leucine-rich repeat protein [Clostridia bacterium]|nr:leucine-rich repeat protein [Clostridia bacterium]
MTIEEKIRIIENTNSFAEIPLEVFPSSHKENYYFVSYSHKDYNRVFKDILKLEEMGINVWYDNEMHIGENWREVAQLYISKFQCSGIIFYLTENSITSPACNQEVEYALKHNKNFLSINVSLDGCPVQSGLGMLKQLKERGFKCERSLVKNFEKAFSDEVLYLGIDESIERKAYQISCIQREELLQVDLENAWSDTEKSLTVSACKDNTIISLDLSKKHEVRGFCDNISAVGDCVFTNSIKLQKVKVSSGLKEIGESAFRNCMSLENIDISKTNGIKIGKNAFKNCAKLKKIDLSNAKEIGERAFEGCALLQVPQLNGAIGPFAFSELNLDEISYISENPKIEKDAFFRCKKLKRFDITGKFSCDLGDSAFYGCSALESVGPFITASNFENDINSPVNFGAYAFYDCESLKRVSIQGNWSFENSSGAFSSCTGLEELDLDVTGKVIPYGFARSCKNLCKITKTEKFTEIGEKAFDECSSLTYFDLTNAKNLGECAFSESGIERVYLKSVKNIGRSAFANCRQLKSVYIGSECETIADCAFLCCNSLQTVKVLSEKVKATEKREAFIHIREINSFYLRSKDLFESLCQTGVAKGITLLYLGDNLNCEELNLDGFVKVESDENGFYKYKNCLKEEKEVDEEELIDISDAEINEPDLYREKYTNNSIFNFIGKDVLIKHSRLKRPRVYFVEHIKTLGDDYKIDYLTLSIHNGKSFKLDGSLIESIQLAQKVIGRWFEIDDPDELNGKNCCIMGNDELHYCRIEMVQIGSFLGVPMRNANFKYAVEKILYSEDDELKMISGIDIESIIIFNEEFETEKVIKREKSFFDQN